MPIIKEALREELERLREKEQAYRAQIQELPKGKILHKKISGRAYPYLMYREGTTVKSKYVKPDELQELSRHLERRQQFSLALKGIREDIKIIQKVIRDGK